MIDKKQFLVNVRCTTYNHSAYIEDAMNGFAMQQTDFPFVCSIIDDASTDGEQEILKKYLDKNFELGEGSGVINEETDDYVLTLAQHKTNKNCYFAVLFLKYNHYGTSELKARRWTYLKEWEEVCKYIALCEGDDYWIEPLKLQKQVDFLEIHPEYSMCFHNARLKNETNSDFKLIEVENREYQSNELFERWIVPTASMIVNSEIMKQLPVDLRIINGDINIVMNAYAHGKVYGMNDVMSVYRVHSNGITIKREKVDNLGLQKRYIGHYKALSQLYPFIPVKLLNARLCDTYINIGVLELTKQPFSSIKTLMKALVLSPLQFLMRLRKLLIK